MLTNSIIISVIRYPACIVISSNNATLSKLQVLIMKCSRPILGFNSYQYSTSKIMQLLNWSTIYQIIMKESILLVHKSVYENKPKAITQFYTYSLNTDKKVRSICKPIIKDHHNSKHMNKTLLLNGLYLYNQLSEDIKYKNPKLLSKYINKYISHIFPSDRITRYNPG